MRSLSLFLMLSLTGASLLVRSTIAQDVSKVGVPPSERPASPFPGYVPPASIPGYEPSTDPRDFTGVWKDRLLPGADRFGLAKNLDYFNERGKSQLADRLARMKAAGATARIATPSVMCRPGGLTQAGVLPLQPIYILQNERKLVFVITDEIRNVRQIHLDRGHPKKIDPSYSGDSVAKWEGNTLVIDTVGYNGRGDHGAIPGTGMPPIFGGVLHSDQMHLVERITKSEDGRTLTIEATVFDPVTMSAPLELHKEWQLVNGQQPLEFDCEENPREDNFADVVFLEEYLKPVCIQHDGEGDERSKVVCEKVRKE